MKGRKQQPDKQPEKKPEKWWVSRLAARGVMVITALGLTLGLVATPAVAQSSSDARTCSAVRQRLARAPRILARIETNLDRLDARLDNTRLPTRRAPLENRIERLEALRTELAQKIADARRACGSV